MQGWETFLSLSWRLELQTDFNSRLESGVLHITSLKTPRGNARYGFGESNYVTKRLPMMWNVMMWVSEMFSVHCSVSSLASTA